MPNQLAKLLRQRPTEAERILWRHLRRKQIGGFRFRRQYPIGRYIVDFVCLPVRLVIEADGGQHAEAVEEDAARSAWLIAQGFTVVRFWNNEILANTAGVLQRIDELVAERARTTPPPAPSRKGRGRR